MNTEVIRSVFSLFFDGGEAGGNSRIFSSFIKKNDINFKGDFTMKKTLIALLVAVTMVLALAVSASAADPAATVTASAQSAKVGDTITFTVALSGTEKGTSSAPQVSYSDDYFEFVSSEYKKSGAMLSTYDQNNKAGALAFQAATDFNGDYFAITLKVKAASPDAQTVSIEVQVKDGSKLVNTVSGSASVKCACAEHTWGGWTVSVPAECEKAGKETNTCTACGETEEREIKALNHAWGEWTDVIDEETSEPVKDDNGNEKQMRVCANNPEHVEYRYDYKVAEDSEKEWTGGSEKGMTVATSIPADQVETIKVGDKELTKGEDYTVDEETGKVTLTPAFLATLEAGENEVVFTTVDGQELPVTFTVVAAPAPVDGADQTGDNGMALWIAVMVLSLVGVAGTAYSLKRRA